MVAGSLPFELIPTAGLCLNSDGVIICTNESFNRLVCNDSSWAVNKAFDEISNKVSWAMLLSELESSVEKTLNLPLTVPSNKSIYCKASLSIHEDKYYVFLQDAEPEAFIPECANISKTQRLLNGINEAYWQWNIKEGTIYHSKLLMALLGYDESAYIGPTSFWEQHVDLKDLEQVYNQNTAHFNGDIPEINLIFPITTKKNKKLWVNLVGKVTEHKKGKVYKMFGSIKDVTEQQKNLQRLKKQNNYLHLAEKISNSGHWFVDLINDTLLWSSGIYHIHGVNPRSYKPTVENALNFYPTDEKEKVEGYLKRSIEDKTSFRFKSQIVNKQGEQIKVEVLGDVELNSEGEVVGIFGVFRDINDTETVLEKLKLMALVNHTIKVPIFFVNEQDCIIYQDLFPQTEKGKENENVVLFNYINFSITDYLTFKRKAKQEGQIIRKDISFDNFSTVFDISVTYEASEGVYIWIVDDTTEKFRKEQQQIISNRLALLGNTFGNVSHDINNVLGVALGATEMLELKYSLGEKNISGYIDRVKNAIDKGKSVTERLLAFTRKPTVNVIQFDPMVEIEKNKYLFKQLLLSTIEFTLDIDNIHCEINFPQGEFINILLNLVLNSQDAIREKGLIGKIAISAKVTENKHLEIHVKDSGVGIKDENLTKIFDPFYSSKSVNKGNGIGLANVYSTIYKHNGEILVDGYSELGGAHFTLVFQCKVKHKSTKSINEMPTHKSVNLTGKRVLILDDEVSIAEFIALFLESKNIDAYHVTNRTELNNMLEEDTHFDVFITDMILPDISGREAVEIVKAAFPDITVYSISGYIGEEDNKWHYPVLRKPFNSEELAEFLST